MKPLVPCLLAQQLPAGGRAQRKGGGGGSPPNSPLFSAEDAAEQSQGEEQEGEGQEEEQPLTPLVISLPLLPY